MEVNHDVHAETLGTQSLDKNIILVTPVVVLGGVNPYAKPYGIHAHLLHQRCTLTLLAVIVLQAKALSLHLRTPADVRTKGKIVCPQRCTHRAEQK